MVNLFRGVIPAAAGLAAAVAAGGISAFLGIAFFEGGAFARGWLSPGPERGVWVLALAPVLAGIICAAIKNRIGGHFLGLADTVLAARRGCAQPFRAAALSVLASFTAFSGGVSVGQYGPVGHLGGFIGGSFRRFWGRGAGPACGVAAAIAAAFNAPVTGLLFACEVVMRRYSAANIAPPAIGAVVGWFVSAHIFNRPAFLPVGDMRAFAPSDFLFFGALGLVFGALSSSYLGAIFALSRRLSRFPAMPLFAVSGAVCGALWALYPEAAGGRELLREAVEGGMDWREALSSGAVKAAATVLCLGAGFAGGVVGPTLVVGASAGALFAAFASAVGVYDGPAVAPVVCGMIAFTAPVIGAPLAGILFVLELSGGNYPLTVAASVSVALSVSAAAKSGGSYYERQLRARGISESEIRRE